MTARHPIWDSGQSWSMFSLTRLNLHSAFPFVHFWQTIFYLTFCRLNQFIANRNCAKEGEFPKVRCVSFRFPPAPLGTESALFTLLISNNSELRAKWRVYTEPPNSLPSYFQMKNLKVPFDAKIKEDKKFLSALWANKITQRYKNILIEKSSTASCSKPGCACIKVKYSIKT